MIIWDSKEDLPTNKNIYLWNEYSEVKNIKSILRYIEKNSELINDLLETIEVGSLSALGGGLPLAIKNLLEHCYDEFKPLMEKYYVR